MLAEEQEAPVPVIIQGEGVRRVDIQVQEKLDWYHNSDTLFRKSRRLRSFSVYNRLLQTCLGLCEPWGAGTGAAEACGLNQLVKKTGSVVRLELDRQEGEVQDQTHPG